MLALEVSMGLFGVPEFPGASMVYGARHEQPHAESCCHRTSSEDSSGLDLRAVQPSHLLCVPPPLPPMSPQWIIAELACYTYSMVVVPLYDTLGPGAIRYIINTGEPTPPLPTASSPPLPRPPRLCQSSNTARSTVLPLSGNTRVFCYGPCVGFQSPAVST